MNEVMLLGRLAKDPEIKYTNSAEPLCIANFTLAVGKRFKKEGEPDADFINCTAFRKTAEIIEKHVKKGQMIAVCGSLSVRPYDIPESGKRRWYTTVNVDEFHFAESKASFESRAGQQLDVPPVVNGSGQPSSGWNRITQSIDEDDDLPF